MTDPKIGSRDGDEPEAPRNDSFPRGLELPDNSPLFWVANKDRYLRQLLIRDIERDTGLPLCVYFASAEVPSRITQEDVGRLYEITSPYRGKKFDLLIETGGGATDAAEALVGMLRSLSPEFRVIVPNRAKSNGTLISLAASEIIMGVTSELGPIEPAVSGIPSNILVLKEYQSIGFGLHMLGTYALGQTKKVAIKVLQTGMLSKLSEDQVTKIVEKLCTRDVYPSHGSVINHAEAKRLGLNVAYLDDNSQLWKKYWLLYCMYMFDAKTRGLSKIFEQRTYSHSVTGPEGGPNESNGDITEQDGR